MPNECKVLKVVTVLICEKNGMLFTKEVESKDGLHEQAGKSIDLQASGNVKINPNPFVSVDRLEQTIRCLISQNDLSISLHQV